MTERVTDSTNEARGKLPVALLVAAGVAVLGLAVTYFSGLARMTVEWQREEYSHGYLIPVIALFLLWRERRALVALPWKGMWLGLGMVVAGLLLMLLGELSALYIIVQYAFILTLAGLALALVGSGGVRYLWVPIVYLVFMIPLPVFLYNSLSSELQLISSQIGVWVIRLFGISVFLQGNVIDLGIYKLQVVEACSGLRYLFPLMSFGFLCAYLYRGPWWQRVIVFLSSIPLTVLMNSFRIGVIGVLVNRWGIEQAEGFLHMFEGWIIFMACVGLMFLEIIVLMKLSGDKRSLRDAFNVDSGEPVEDVTALSQKTVGRPLAASLVVLLAVAVGVQYLKERTESVPERPVFAELRLEVGEWEGRPKSVESDVLDVLKMDDWLSADFSRPGEVAPIDVWVAYYGSQRKGASVHSPRSCLPGGGWRIDSLDSHAVTGIPGEAGPVYVNRAEISYGEQKMLVYYWFKQRDRNLTNEYLVKWYLFWDSITRNRTDGALIRLTKFVPDGFSVEEADAALTEFMREGFETFSAYVPD